MIMISLKSCNQIVLQKNGQSFILTPELGSLGQVGSGTGEIAAVECHMVMEDRTK